MSGYSKIPEEIGEKGSKEGQKENIIGTLAGWFDKRQYSMNDPKNPYNQTYNLTLHCLKKNVTMIFPQRKIEKRLSDPESTARTEAFREMESMHATFTRSVNEVREAASGVHYSEVVDFYRSQSHSAEKAESKATKLKENIDREVSRCEGFLETQDLVLSMAVHRMDCQTCLSRFKCTKLETMQKQALRLARSNF